MRRSAGLQPRVTPVQKAGGPPRSGGRSLDLCSWTAWHVNLEPICPYTSGKCTYWTMVYSQVNLFHGYNEQSLALGQWPWLWVPRPGTKYSFTYGTELQRLVYCICSFWLASKFTTEKLWSLSNPTFCIFLFVMLLLKLSPAWDSIWRILVSSISGWELEMAAYEGCNTRSLIPTNTTWCKIGGVTRKLCRFLPRLKVWKYLSDISWTSLFFLLFHFMFLLYRVIPAILYSHL